ncbi:hypothetical protein [Cupriavidus metallidurans]|uniref:hypothetical protein n=1 Tax=Cupriavidus metallidurans TaxID=119219 RepID=UPI001BFC1F52|nr:hypothetical protein [Cupriavidus metallidurans]QWC91307.1 hypothetical protein KB891_27880 [Cupriavidus metallidurans]
MNTRGRIDVAIPAAPLPPSRLFTDLTPRSFLLDRLPTPDQPRKTLAARLIDAAQVEPPEAVSACLPPWVRQRYALGRVFVPTAAEQEVAERMLTMIWLATAAYGESLAEINRTYLRAVGWDGWGHRELARSNATHAIPQSLLVSAPCTMQVAKLLRAMQAMIGPFFEHKHVFERLADGTIHETDASIEQIGLLPVRMPERPYPADLYLNICDAIDDLEDTQLYRSERFTNLRAQEGHLRQVLAGLHVGLLAVYGVDSQHLSTGLTAVWGLLEKIRDWGVPVAVFVTSAILHSPLTAAYCHLFPEPCYEIPRLGPADARATIAQAWSALGLAGEVPGEMLDVARQCFGQRDWIEAALTEYLSLLHHESRAAADRALHDLHLVNCRGAAAVPFACWTHFTATHERPLQSLQARELRDWFPVAMTKDPELAFVLPKRKKGR